MTNMKGGGAGPRCEQASGDGVAVATGGRAAPPAHPRFPGVCPAPWLHLRPGTGAPSQGQAPSGARGPIRAGALLQGRQFQGTDPPEKRGGALVQGRRRGNGCTAPPGGNRWRSSRSRSAMPSCCGTAFPTRSPTGAPLRCIPTITSPASMPSIRCLRPPARRVSRWRSG